MYGKMNMMDKRFILLGVYLFTAPIILFVLIFYSLFYHHENVLARKPSVKVLNYNGNFEALPNSTVSTSGINLQSTDARISALDDFFKRYKSPLVSHSKHIVEHADKYGFDYRLLPAIAMQESNLCKKIPKGADHNCWGFGIYGKKRTGFESYERAIEVISKTLAEQYIEIGLETPEQIMSKYTPNSNGSWANSVIFFMNQIQENI